MLADALTVAASIACGLLLGFVMLWLVVNLRLARMNNRILTGEVRHLERALRAQKEAHARTRAALGRAQLVELPRPLWDGLRRLR